MNGKIGYVKVYRSLLQNEIYQMPPIFLRIFERLILEANHQDVEIPYRKNGNTSTKAIKRGERLTSIRQIADWVGWYERGVLKTPNPKTVKEVLDYLVERNMIFIYNESNRTETHYNVVNYDIYQDKEDVKVTEQKRIRNELETNQKRLVLQVKNDKNDKNDKNKKDICNSVVEKFNDVCVSLPKVAKVTSTREKAIKARLAELGGDLEKLEEVFKLVEESDFLAGRSGQWQANFDWVMKPANFVKILEGNYKNKKQAEKKKANCEISFDVGF